MSEKFLFVVTNHDTKGSTGEPTGFYLSEVTHPWRVLRDAGYEIDFVSPKGGKAPAEGVDLSDNVNEAFWNDPACRAKVENTLKPKDINPEEYLGVFYAGGHGTMWDFPDNADLATMTRRFFEGGAVVSAVCHGPSALVNVKLSNGEYLVNGKKINAFTDAEESAVRMDKVVPFLLESRLIEHGAIFEKSGLWEPHVTVDGRLVTGQNPQSARRVGETIVQLLRKKMAA